jgi:hypothetical protein
VLVCHVSPTAPSSHDPPVSSWALWCAEVSGGGGAGGCWCWQLAAGAGTGTECMSHLRLGCGLSSVPCSCIAGGPIRLSFLLVSHAPLENQALSAVSSRSCHVCVCAHPVSPSFEFCQQRAWPFQAWSACRAFPRRCHGVFDSGIVAMVCMPWCLSSLIQLCWLLQTTDRVVGPGRSIEEVLADYTAQEPREKRQANGDIKCNGW